MKFAIRNRYGKTFFAHVCFSQNPDRIVFVQHGYCGSVDGDHIKQIIATYKKNNYTVIAFDCTNSCNDADGTLDKSTIDTHLHDLEDGIAWATLQSWYHEPFALAGHSLGGFSALLYAEANPEKISQLTLHGVDVADRVPHAIPPNEHNRFYLETKANRSGHWTEPPIPSRLPEQSDPVVVSPVEGDR